MTPFFDPGPSAYGHPKVFLAAVGQKMTEVAGEVADGLLCHGFTTASYLQETTLPALETGADRAGRSRADLELSIPAFVVTGRDEDEMARSAAGVRRQVAFYGSTPAYHPVLELHGWGDLARELNTLSKRGEWEAMGEAVDDEVLHTIAIVAEPDEVGPALERRFGGVAQRIPLYAPRGSQTDRWGPALAHLQALP
jgi:probable F420-dependent oxidoreductase